MNRQVTKQTFIAVAMKINRLRREVIETKSSLIGYTVTIKIHNE